MNDIVSLSAHIDDVEYLSAKTDDILFLDNVVKEDIIRITGILP